MKPEFCVDHRAHMVIDMNESRLNTVVPGPATVYLLPRAYARYGDPPYQRLAGLSVSHLYNLRAQASYQTQRGVWARTKAQTIATGQRRARPPRGVQASSAPTVSTGVTLNSAPGPARLASPSTSRGGLQAGSPALPTPLRPRLTPALNRPATGERLAGGSSNTPVLG